MRLLIPSQFALLVRSVFLYFPISFLFICTSLTSQAAQNPQSLSQSDLQFLNRVTYGINSTTVEKFKSLGREQFLQSQLAFSGDKGLPEDIRLHIANMDISRLSPSDLLSERHQAEQQLKAASDAEIKGKLQQSLNQRGNDIAMQATERRLLRAIYSENQLQELLTWFWFNHFNIFQHKGYNNLLLADYEEHAIRPHVLGKFRDLVLATLTHPAMLVYLDNAQNASGAVNENYAREIMELHTLGINGGYKQNDVENLAHILTGVGVDLSGNKCPQGQTKLGNYTPTVQDGLFCYSPNRHDQNAKNFLGHSFPIEGGAEEVVRAVDILVQNPATAKFISRKLAVYFLADNPPESVINDMSRAFQKSDGNVAKTLNVLFHSSAFQHGNVLANKYKDPVQYVISSLRLLYGTQPIQDIRPAVNWINQLGEPIYAHLTPDGYGMSAKDWLSADQMAKRFEISRAIFGNAGILYTNEALAKTLEETDKKRLQELRKEAREQHPVDTFGIYDLMRPALSDKTMDVLKKSLTMDDWNSLLLSSPEFMYR
jgi:uncharacterized protein (DUF1800 family)